MATNRKVVVVTGATGTQGSGVVQALLLSKEFQVRALTRNASSEAAQALVERGIEVVSADLANKQSLPQAFSGAHGLFLMTEAGMDKPDEEIQLGKNAADAAKQAGIQHIVFSGLFDTRPYFHQLPLTSSGRRVPHYETKAEIKDYMQKLGLPVTTIYPSAFLENFFKYTMYMKQPDGTIFWSNNQSIDKQPWHSCHATGTAVQEALQNPDRCIGKTFAVKSEMVSAGELSEMISQVTGEKLVFHCMTDEKARSLPFPGAVAFANMFTFWRECTEAKQQMAELPTLGQSEGSQIWVEQHKEAFSKVLANARPASGG